MVALPSAYQKLANSLEQISLELPEIDILYFRVYSNILQLLELKLENVINRGTNKVRVASKIDERGRRF